MFSFFHSKLKNPEVEQTFAVIRATGSLRYFSTIFVDLEVAMPIFLYKIKLIQIGWRVSVNVTFYVFLQTLTGSWWNKHALNQCTKGLSDSCFGLSSFGKLNQHPSLKFDFHCGDSVFRLMFNVGFPYPVALQTKKLSFDQSTTCLLCLLCFMFSFNCLSSCQSFKKGFLSCLALVNRFSHLGCESLQLFDASLINAVLAWPSSLSGWPHLCRFQGVPSNVFRW